MTPGSDAGRGGQRRPPGHTHERGHARGPRTEPHRHEEGDGLGHAHAHGVGGLHRGTERRRLTAVFAMTAAFMVAEVVGGLLSGSLALLADAGHMLTDAAALALSLLAIRWAQRPPDAERTYGLVRAEILAALVNGASLLLIAGLIAREAWERVREPVAVDAPIMLSVAAAGLVVNVLGAWILHAGASENLNVRGAYLHVLGDLLGSLAAVFAGAVILFTGWNLADPIISVLIALLILASAWRLVREATEVLLEAAPSHIDVDEVRARLEAVDGLEDVHDLHVWTLTSGFVALSGHGIVDDPTRTARVLEDVRVAASDLGIGHVTFQLEPRPLYQIPPRAPAEGATP